MTDDLVKRLRVRNAYSAPDFSTPIADPVKLEAADRIEELDAKLVKAVSFAEGVVRYAGNCGDDYLQDQARTTVEELEAENKRLRLEAAHSDDTADAALDHIEELETKLAKAVEALETIVDNGGAGSYHLARTTLEELKGPER